MYIKDFNDIELDPETKLLSRKIIQINGIACAHEFWSWDGINGESLIFYKDDLLPYSDDDIYNLAFADIVNKPKSHTLKRTEKFIYLNFNFIIT